MYNDVVVLIFLFLFVSSLNESMSETVFYVAGSCFNDL